MKQSFYAHAPGMPHAITIRAEDETAAKALFREFLNVKRLPEGAEVWPATETESA